MPELPEIETIRRDLNEYLAAGDVITGAKINDFKFTEKHSNLTDSSFLVNMVLNDISRIGKVLILHLDKGYLGFHLGMSGQIVNDLNNTRYPGHLRFSLNFGKKSLYYIDIRKFGWIRFETDLQKLLPPGKEPFSTDFTFDYFKACLNSRRPVKIVLMDQNLIAGIGNIYANEMLFLAGIYPEKSSNHINGIKLRILYDFLFTVLENGINNYGTTFSIFRNLKGEKGTQQNILQVYGREGEKCLKCGKLIKKITVGGRSSFYCPKCQHP